MPAANRTTPTFTPGPWTVYAENDYDSHGRFEVIGADQRDLAMIRPSYRTVDEQRANAHLIASSPALYAALHAVMDAYFTPTTCTHDSEPDICDACAYEREKAVGYAFVAARVALAQAEGRSS